MVKRAIFCSNKLEGIVMGHSILLIYMIRFSEERVLFLKGDIKDNDGHFVDSVSLELKNLDN